MPKVRRCTQKSESTDSDSDWFSENAEKQNISRELHKSNKVNRWVRMMNGSDNINLTFLQILGEIEDNIIERFTEFQKDVNNNINAKLNDSQNKVCEVLYTSEEIKEFKTILEIPIPISDLEIFKQFDDDLENDNRKQQALKKLLRYSTNGSQSVTKDISKLMNLVITNSVQQFFTAFGYKKGCGESTKGCRESKKGFCFTSTYGCMQDVLVEKYKQSAQELKLTAKFSRWLSQKIIRYSKLHNIDKL